MKKLLLAVLALILLGGWEVPAQSAWLNYGADAGRSGFTAENPTLPLSTLWKFYYPDINNETTPAADKGRVYLVSRHWLFCLDQNNGARLWEYDAVNDIPTSPTLVDSDVIISDVSGRLLALDAATGKIQWEKRFDGTVLSPPLYYQGKLIAGFISRQVVALNPSTGETIWSFIANGPVSLPLVASQNTIFALDSAGNIYGLDAASGRKLWASRSNAVLTVPPVTANSVLYVAAGNFFYGLTLNGSVLWHARSDQLFTLAPAISGTNLYLTGPDGALYCMFTRSGSVKWVYQDPEVILTTSPTVAGNTILVGGSRGAILALDATSGNLLWKCQTRTLNTPVDRPGDQSGASQPVLSDGHLFLLYNDGSLTCFTPDAPDLFGPTVTEVEPSGSQMISGKLPLPIQARIFDEGSGLDPASVEFYLDGAKQEINKDPDTGVYLYVVSDETPGGNPQAALADGVHTATLSAKDYRGNLTQVTWKFATDKTLPISEARRLKKPAPKTTTKGQATTKGGLTSQKGGGNMQKSGKSGGPKSRGR